MSKRKQLVGIAALLILAAITVFVVARTTSASDLSQVGSLLRRINPVWLALCACCPMGCLLVEGRALQALCARLGHPVRLRESVMWASADYYISGITPLATGGQPAAAYFMQKAGIPLSKATLLLVFFTMQYQASMLLLGLPCFLFAVFHGAGIPPLALGLIIYGYTAVLLVLLACVLCMVRPAVIRHIASVLIRALGRLRLLRNPQRKLARLETALEEYAGAAGIIGRDPGAVGIALGANLLLRILPALPLCLLSLGLGLPASGLALIFSLNILCVIGAGSIPIPGTVGAAELIFTLLLRPVLGEDLAPVMLINRLLVFYLCVLVGGVWTWIRMIRKKT